MPLYPWMHLVGRVLFSLVFVYMGVHHFAAFAGVKGRAASHGVPAPGPAVALAGILILVGGVLLALGWHRFIGAGLIVIFCPAAALLVHPPWKQQDPLMRQNALEHFLKNLALAGAALFMAVYAGTWWPLSLGG